MTKSSSTQLPFYRRLSEAVRHRHAGRCRCGRARLLVLRRTAAREPRSRGRSSSPHSSPSRSPPSAKQWSSSATPKAASNRRSKPETACSPISLSTIRPLSPNCSPRSGPPPRRPASKSARPTTRATPSRATTATVWSPSVRISAVSTDSLVKLLHRLDRSERFLIIERLAAAPRDEGDLAITMRIDAFVRDL